MKEMLFDKYWSNFWIWLTISLTIILVFVILIRFRNKLLFDKVNTSHTRFIRVIVFTSIIAFAIFSLIKFTFLCVDLSFVNSNECEIFIGDFVEYTRYVESNTPGSPRGSNPLFKDENSNEELILSGTHEYEVDVTYTIYYLPNSMLYVVDTN